MGGGVVRGPPDPHCSLWGRGDPQNGVSGTPRPTAPPLCSALQYCSPTLCCWDSCGAGGAVRGCHGPPWGPPDPHPPHPMGTPSPTSPRPNRDPKTHILHTQWAPPAPHPPRPTGTPTPTGDPHSLPSPPSLPIPPHPPPPHPPTPHSPFPYRLRRPPRSWRRFSTGQLPCVKWEGGWSAAANQRPPPSAPRAAIGCGCRQ